MSAKSKRPKVRYVQFYTGFDPAGYMVCRKDYDGVLNRHLCDCDTESSAKRIAAALNLYEAVKRREM